MPEINPYKYYYDLAISILPELKNSYEYDSENIKKIQSIEMILIEFKNIRPELDWSD